MSDRIQSIDALCDTPLATDPRVTETCVRQVEVDGVEVILVGVVHDHPASIYRAASVVDVLDPETVAVELPGLLVPAVTSAAEDGGAEVAGDEGSGDPAIGGEMAAAVGSTTGAVAGIDVPSRGTLRSVLTELRTDPVGVRTAVRTVRNLGRITAHAILGRVASLDLPWTPSFDGIEKTQEYDLAGAATPAEQAEHERRHLNRSTTLLRSFNPPPATAFLDRIRERQMATRLAAQSSGTVVAVIGYGHLEPVETLLENGVA